MLGSLLKDVAVPMQMTLMTSADSPEIIAKDLCGPPASQRVAMPISAPIRKVPRIPRLKRAWAGNQPIKPPGNRPASPRFMVEY